MKNNHKAITHSYFKVNKHLSTLEEPSCSGCNKKNYISYFRNHLLIVYVSKIKFKRYRLREKCSKKLKRSFSNLIL